MKRAAPLFLILAMLGVRAHAGDGAKKPPEGFSSLFDGKSLSHWQLDEKQKASWKVEDGTIHYTGNRGRNLATARTYGNFEMYVDWKITKGGDSGVYLRGLPQVQIWDNKEGSGGLYNNPPKTPGQKPLVVADNPVGEWNTFYIKMVGDKVTVKLNGKLVVDDAPLRYGKKEPPPAGPIELQIHGTPLWFRNIHIKELN